MGTDALLTWDYTFSIDDQLFLRLVYWSNIYFSNKSIDSFLV